MFWPAIPGAPPRSNGASLTRRPPMILVRTTRWCIVGLTNSACRMRPKISSRSTSRRLALSKANALALRFEERFARSPSSEGSGWSRNASPENKVRRIEIFIMPGTTAVPDIELIVEDIGGGGGGPTPPAGGGDDGDGGGDDRNRHGKWSPSPKRYSTAIAIGIVSILIFFMALASAFIVLRRSSELWVTVRLPPVLWANTCVLLASRFTLASARRRLSLADSSR